MPLRNSSMKYEKEASDKDGRAPRLKKAQIPEALSDRQIPGESIKQLS